jgi:multiple sugar transport system ATP-binding protein
MVFQNFALYPSMTVYENIAFPLEVWGTPKSEVDGRVRSAARLVGVESLLSRGPKQVSGGEAQRVALARALVRRPDVFLMDEPLSNLDAKLRVQLRTEIKRLHRETQTTTIYVTHDQEEAMTLGDKIVVMNLGQVQQVGSPHEIFYNPKNVFVAGFVGSPSMNLVPGTLRTDDKGEFIVQLPGFSQKVPHRLSGHLNRSRVEKITWGIWRPEHIKIVSVAEEGDVPGTIEVVEPLGSRQFLYVRVGEWVFTVVTEARADCEVGQACHLRFDQDQLRLFDVRTELSVEAPQDGG